MSRQRHIKSKSTTTYEEPYVNIKRPTNATFIPKETMETNEEKAYIRQTSQNVYAEPRLAEDSKTKRSKEKKGYFKIMEGTSVGSVA